MSEKEGMCPVCGENFPFLILCGHVHECLGVLEEYEKERGFVYKPSTSPPTSPVYVPKRKTPPDSAGTDGTLNEDDEFVAGVSGGGESNRTPWGSLVPYQSGPKKSRLESSPRKTYRREKSVSALFDSKCSSPDTTTRVPSFQFQSSSTTRGNGPLSKSPSTSSRNPNFQQPPSTATNTTSSSRNNNTNNKTTNGERDLDINFNVPLAQSSRPKTVEAFVGQTKSFGDDSFIRKILLKRSLPPSLIFWGPPGSGKTTIAKLISCQCKEDLSAKVITMSATNSGVNDVKQAVQTATTNKKMFNMKTIVFIDEIHRFNKIQQDSLLPHVEIGTFILLGATTENPSFHVISALLSRCHVVVLEKLSINDISTILTNAVESLNIKCFSDVNEIDNILADNDSSKLGRNVWINSKVIEEIASLCDGDARVALNCLQMAVQSQTQRDTGKDDGGGDKDMEIPENSPTIINVDCVKDCLERSCILYDKKGEEHYNCASALQKSIRGSDPDAAVYWLARMLEGGETPLFVARRLVRTASEDIGSADPQALTHAVAAFQATSFLGMPECDVILAQCAVYLARAPKSYEVCAAYGKAKQCILEQKGPLPSVPLHLRNASTAFMKSLGYGKGYVSHSVDNSIQTYLPSELLHVKFLE